MTTSKTKRTVRELGGEIWAELQMSFEESQLDCQTRNNVVDLVMGVLARYDGAIIENDVGLAVLPLPKND